MDTPQTIAVKSLLGEPIAQADRIERHASATRYEASPMCGSNLEQDNAEREDALYGQRPPPVDIKTEKPEHRRVIQLRLEGHTNKEIAELVGLSSVHVSTIIRQPWARKYIMDSLKREGRDGLLELLESEAENSVWKLIEVRDSADSQGEQRKAANDILNRLLGSPVQALVHSGKVDYNNMSDEELTRIATQSGRN